MEPSEFYIQEISRKCGILIPKDDPIIFLHTFLEHFLQDLDSHQTQLYQTFASHMEADITKWNEAITLKASRVLASALEVSRKEAEGRYQNATEEFVQKLAAIFEEQRISNKKKLRSVYNLAVMNMIGAGLLTLAAMFIFLK